MYYQVTNNQQNTEKSKLQYMLN